MYISPSSPSSAPSAAGSPSRRSVLAGTAAAAAGTALAPLTTASSAYAYTGDPVFPNYGDVRYSVSHYFIGDTIITNYSSSVRVSGKTDMTCRAAVALADIEIDTFLRPNAIYVNGVKKPFTKPNVRKVKVTGLAIAAGASFTVTVRYDDNAVQARVAAGNPLQGDGLMVGPSCVSFFGEPNGAMYWYACNDRLSNKATYSISISTRRGTKIAGTGAIVKQYDFMSGTTAMTNMLFAINQPVHSWVPAVHIGALTQDVSTWTSPTGQRIPTLLYSAVSVNMSVMRFRTHDALSYISRLYGPYPFDRAGGIVVQLRRNDYWAIENVGMPAYTPDMLPNAYFASFIAHENSHMWFGNSVTASSWNDIILLHEGIASIIAHDYCLALGIAPIYPARTDPAATQAVTSPKPTSLIQFSTYQGAVGVLLELRKAMDGSDQQPKAPRFTAFLRGLAQDFRYGHITRAQFKARAQAATPNSLGWFWTKYKL